ncbi:hypothetical protein OHC33_000572 [Knufia fluminis]|uniref:SnoaL-like domain-containing protein n=1 Tax=Knufia fluminis TaxID=191047 RepID=A0AAN8I9E1_9EURO|nr:hypothetical protein OHC33_000572 [Knufia fluminis]
MASTSTQRATALAFLDSFDKLDGDANIALRAPNCRHTMAPTSLNFKPDMTNEQWTAHLNSTKEVLTSFPVMAKEIFENGNQVTIWATSEANFREEAKDDEEGVDWTYHGEYMFVLLFDGDGKIERIVEFLDSVKVVQVGALIERAKRNLKARKEGAS